MGGSNKEKRKGTRSSPGRKTPTVVNYGRAPAPTAAGGSEGCGALGGPLPGGPFHPPGPATALAQPQRGGGKAKTPGSCCSPDGSRAQDLGVGGGKRRAKSKRAARASVPMEPVAASGGGAGVAGWATWRHPEQATAPRTWVAVETVSFRSATDQGITETLQHSKS